MGEQQPGITCHGTCRRCHEHKALVTHGSMCQDCLNAIEGLPQWQHVTPTIRVDIGRYGREVDDEEIAYLLRMGGIDAEIVEAGRG